MEVLLRIRGGLNSIKQKEIIDEIFAEKVTTRRIPGYTFIRGSTFNKSSEIPTHLMPFEDPTKLY